MDSFLSVVGNYFKDVKSTTVILLGTIGILYVSNFVRNYLKMRVFFKHMNLPGPRPWPLAGNFVNVMKKGIHQNDIDMAKMYGKTYGYFEGSQPIILTSDVKFIKSFLIKDFNSFVNRRSIESLEIESFSKILTVLKDDEWKNVRSILTTSFTSGKIKSMSKCMLNCIKNYEKYLGEVVEKDGIISTKAFFGCYTLDVISSCCFGMDINSIYDPENEFLKNLQGIFGGGDFTSNPKFILLFLFPRLSKHLARLNLVEFFPSDPMNFLAHATNAIIDRRKAKLEVRDDFIQSMVEHEENLNASAEEDEKEAAATWNGYLKKTLSKKEILSQAVLFFLAGYETTATTIEYIFYNLAKNPDVQDKLIEEVDSILEKYNGEVKYDSIYDMKYMDMVIDETLRMYPAAPRTDRVASNDYEYEGIRIKKGQVVAVPIYALHHDPDIYPNPEVFDPERFSDENKKKRDNVTFLPFGAGPRNCIGMRFALIEIKLLLSSILSKYRFTTCDKTPEKIVFDKSGFSKSLKPIYLKVEKR